MTRAPSAAERVREFFDRAAVALLAENPAAFDALVSVIRAAERAAAAEMREQAGQAVRKVSRVFHSPSAYEDAIRALPLPGEEGDER